MNSLSRLNHLFFRHLRIVYHGEKSLAATFLTMSYTTSSDRLREFYLQKAREKEAVKRRLETIFRIENMSADGETDPIIEDILVMPPGGDIERKMLCMAELITGSTLNTYQINACNTAISCAEELGKPEIAELMLECKNLMKFQQHQSDFLHAELQTFGQKENAEAA